MIRRLNHAVLFVSNAARAAEFYEQVLGFKTVARMGNDAYFLVAPGSDNGHDLGLFGVGENAQPNPAGRSSVGLYHLAWEVDTLQDLLQVRQALAEAGALVGESDHGESKSLYARDVDGIEFEVMWEVPRDLLDPEIDQITVRPLDWEATIERFGLTTSRNT